MILFAIAVLALVFAVAVGAAPGAAAAAAPGDAAAVAWSGLLPSGSGVVVYTNDSYSVFHSGAAWLSSVPTQMRIDGMWWTSPAPNSSAAAAAAPTCPAPLADWDCSGEDLYFFNATSPDPCCANCSTNPACGAWTYTGITEAEAEAGAPPYWAYRCYIKTGCGGGHSYSGHTSWVAPPPPANMLTRLSAGAISGSDANLGAFEGWAISYAAGATPLTTAFKLYASASLPAPLLVFEATFPEGASGVNSSAIPANTSSLTEFSSSASPSTQFPAFAGAAGSPDVGYVSWQSRFFNSATRPNGGVFSAFASTAIGAEGGPVVLFAAPSGSSGPPPALVIAPLGNAKANELGASTFGTGTLAGGVNSYVLSLPANFSTATSITFSDAGITDAMHAWGATLLAAHGGTERIADSSSQELSYWTDNGAAYSWYSYEPDINSHGVPQDILVALDETFSNGTYAGAPIPVKHYMLDAWWMWNTRANGNCKMNDSSWPLPLPLGLKWLSGTGLKGKGLIVYNGPQCGNSSYGDSWPLSYSVYWNQGWGEGVLSILRASAAEAFYAQTFDSLIAQGMSSFTQDFLDFQGLLFPDNLNDAAGNGGWLAGMAAAAAARGLAIQYCMSLPADILASAAFPAVTNARASQDYGAGGSNWQIGGSSLLLSALKLRASKDNFWTGVDETSPFLVAAVAALSNGPVGFADFLFKTDPAVIWPTTTLNGTLLHPSRPATTLDRSFTGQLQSLGDVRAAHSLIGGLLFYSVLSADQSNASNVVAELVLTDLWPLPSSSSAPAATLLLSQWNNSACSTDGAPATACVAALGAAGAPTAPPYSDRVAWSLWSVAPILGNYCLLGEVSKYVPVSPSRFAAVAAAPGGITVSLLGAPGETVTISFIRNATAPDGSAVAVKALTLSNDGTLTTTLS